MSTNKIPKIQRQRLQLNFPMLLASYGVGTLLVVICIVQSVLANASDLTPWKGGGFGMFSTVDAGANRRMRVTLVSGANLLIIKPPNFGSLRKQVRNLPTEARLNVYANRLAQSIWTDKEDIEAAAEGTATPEGEPSFELASSGANAAPRALRIWTEQMPIPGRVVVVDKVEVTIDRPIFDGETATLRFEPIRTIELPGLSLDEIAEAMGVAQGVLGVHP